MLDLLLCGRGVGLWGSVGYRGSVSDVFSRYMRMAGHHMLMVSGTDEHGTPILVQAEQEDRLTTRCGSTVLTSTSVIGMAVSLDMRRSRPRTWSSVWRSCNRRCSSSAALIRSMPRSSADSIPSFNSAADLLQREGKILDRDEPREARQLRGLVVAVPGHGIDV